jgi:hypothetical protein
VDYTATSNQTLFGRYLYAVYDNPATYDGQNVLTLSRTGQNNQAHSFVLGHNWVLSPTMINSLHVTYNKTVNDRPLPEFFSPADLGINVYGPQPGFMGVTVTNGFGIGAGGTNPGFFNSDSFQIANDTDIVRGRHQISFGGNWIRTKIETLNNRPSNGQFTFNGQTTGLGLADFMLGRLGGFLQGNPVYDFDENDYVGAYVQDGGRCVRISRSTPACGGNSYCRSRTRSVTAAISTRRASIRGSAARPIRRPRPGCSSPATPSSRGTPS